MVFFRTAFQSKHLWAAFFAWLVVFSCASDTRAQAGDETAIREAAEDILSDSSLQTAMPEKREVDLELPTLPILPAWLLKMLAYLMWAGLILGLVLAAYFLVKSLMGRRVRGVPASVKKTDRPTDDAPVSPSRVKTLTGAPLPTFADAEKFAAKGAYGVAIHILLLLVIDDIRRRTKQILQPSLTGREVVRAVGLNADIETIVKYILQMSERVHFGGRNADAEAYSACRDRYQAFAKAMRGRETA